jgi:hypothetical protein
MKRTSLPLQPREFIIAGMAAAWPFASHPQQSGRLLQLLVYICLLGLQFGYWGSQMDQKRGILFRRPLRRRGWVGAEILTALIPCVVWDLSAKGARLAIADKSGDLPTKFFLLLRGEDVRRKCQIVWTGARFVGVKFI